MISCAHDGLVWGGDRRLLALSIPPHKHQMCALARAPHVALVSKYLAYLRHSLPYLTYTPLQNKTKQNKTKQNKTKQNRDARRETRKGEAPASRRRETRDAERTSTSNEERSEHRHQRRRDQGGGHTHEGSGRSRAKHRIGPSGAQAGRAGPAVRGEGSTSREAQLPRRSYGLASR